MPYTRVSDPQKLRRLLGAVLLITNDVELPHLLRTLIVEVCSLVEARYGALGVLNEAHTGLEQFPTVGLDDDEERADRPSPYWSRRPRAVDHRPRAACVWIDSASIPRVTGFRRTIPR